MAFRKASALAKLLAWIVEKISSSSLKYEISEKKNTLDVLNSEFKTKNVRRSIREKLFFFIGLRNDSFINLPQQQYLVLDYS